MLDHTPAAITILSNSCSFVSYLRKRELPLLTIDLIFDLIKQPPFIIILSNIFCVINKGDFVKLSPLRTTPL